MNELSTRLRIAREAAGFATAAEAAERFGWNYATYAGHENGSRGVRIPVAQRYATAFRVSAVWLLEGGAPPDTAATSTAPPAQPQRGNRPSGFSDTEITPYKPATAVEEKALTTAIASLAVGWRHLVLWIAGRDWHPYAILRGDIVAIGTPPVTRDGEVVLVNWQDPDVRTTLAQRVADRFVLPIGEDRPESVPGVYGAVAFVLRAPRR